MKHHTMKTYEKVEVQIHILLILTVDRGEFSFKPPRKSPQYHWRGD
jgi:hypothetical protein